MPNKPKLIGVTGGIGSGKSTVCKIFESLGHKVYYADDRAKWLMQHDLHLMDEVKKLFGDEAYTADGLNRKHIADIAFKDPQKLTLLNEQVHPSVAQDLTNWISKNQQEKVLFDEAALLFEVGSYKRMDENILVTAPEDIRIKRVLARDPHRDEAAVKAIIDKQMRDEDKRPLADYIIKNDGSQSVIKQTMDIYKEIITS